MVTLTKNGEAADVAPELVGAYLAAGWHRAFNEHFEALSRPDGTLTHAGRLVLSRLAEANAQALPPELVNATAASGRC